MATYKVRGHAVRAREATPEHRAAPVQPIQSPGVYHVTVTDRGRLVLPVEIRETLEIRDGDKVAVSVEADGTIEIETRDVAIRKMRGMFKHLNRPGQPLASDRLIAERRREARMEEREIRERAALHRRMARERKKQR